MADEQTTYPYYIGVEFQPMTTPNPVGYGIKDLATGKLVAWLTPDQVESARAQFMDMRAKREKLLQFMRSEKSHD